MFALTVPQATAAAQAPPDTIHLIGVPLWGWQIAVAIAGVLALVLLARTIWVPTTRSLRAWALGNVAVNAGIAVTGATVRVTSSGLGCSEWPKCTPESFVPVGGDHPALNAAIEFGNRTLTFLVLAVGVITLVAVLRSRPRRRDLTRLAVIIPFGVLGQGVVGGITVWTGLHPASVGAHFLLSLVVTFIAVALYVRCQEPEGAPQVSTGPGLHALSIGLVVVGFLLMVAGTVVTGTGPHGGDAEAPRWGFALESVTRMHSSLAWLTLLGAAAAAVAAFRGDARRPVRRSALALAAVVVAQGVLGYVQYALELPEWLVVAHVLGSTLTWIAIARLYFSTTRLVPDGERELSAENADSEGQRRPVGPASGR
ncbi:heme A synthase [Nocardiopsis sp. CNT312]|uniref:COX15/CtaA family protein n=1 Tax=Nocardiopsis sp. CNT312 TaxID=1137268 RepID=UPI0004915893|nr:COX15/CtaA family protein [Nocardiopsis sp. CNT312]